MTNPAVHEIEIQSLELFQVREVLRCILHTIIFNRALGLVQPQTVDSQLFDTISYVSCGDPAAEKKVDEKIEHVCSLVERCPSFSVPAAASGSNCASGSATFSSSSSDASLTRAQVCLSFFEQRPARKPAPVSGVAAGVGAWFGVTGNTNASASSSFTGTLSSLGSSSGAGAGAVRRSSSSNNSSTDSGSSSSSARGGCWEQWHITLNVLPQRHSESYHNAQQHQQQQKPLKVLGGVARSASIGSSSARSLMSVVAAAESATEAAERHRHNARLEAELQEVLLSILMLANENRSRIPPVLTNDIVPFPYEIAVPSLSESAFGLELLKRMLQAAPPPLLS